MNIILSTDIKDYVASQVRSGHYNSESDVITDALRNQRRQSFEKQVDESYRSIKKTNCKW
ncbi:MAG: type II toxin-antitoxin system ParD family antitoxin [Magnetococcales bacterium]|nr:type II toxin-antitoxin system ParD family antitoxin [Magnetococcales bacterium]